MTSGRRRIGAFAAVAVVAATGLVQVATTSAALAATVCNRYCDGRDPALATADRVPVSGSLYGRVFKVHVNDTDAMAWALGGERQRRRRGVAGPVLGRRPELGGRQQAGRHHHPGGRLRPAHRPVQRGRLGRHRGRRGPRLRQGRRPARDHLHRVDAQHLERLGPAHGRGHRADDAVRPGHRAVRHERVVDQRQRAHLGDRQHPAQRHAELHVRDRLDVRQAGQRGPGAVPQRVPGRHRLVGSGLGGRVRRDRGQPLPEHGPRGRRLDVLLLGRHLRRRGLVEDRPAEQERHREQPLHPAERGAEPADPRGHRLPGPGAGRLGVVPEHRDDQRLEPGERRRQPEHLPQQR